jgi:hypothetical protein
MAKSCSCKNKKNCQQSQTTNHRAPPHPVPITQRKWIQEEQKKGRNGPKAADATNGAKMAPEQLETGCRKRKVCISGKTA